MPELDSKKGWVPKNWCLQTVLLEKTLESPLDSKEIKPLNLKGNQPWILTGRTNAEAKAPVFWLSDVNSGLVGKVPDARKDWGQKEKRVSEDEKARWHHRCNGHELEQTSGAGEGQEGLGAAVHGIAKSRTQLDDWTTKWQQRIPSLWGNLPSSMKLTFWRRWTSLKIIRTDCKLV